MPHTLFPVLQKTLLPFVCLLTGLASTQAPAADKADVVLGEIVVTAPLGDGLARDRVPTRVQTASASDISAMQPLDVTDLLNRGFGSVSINQAQNNPLQPDLNFRGQTASPLLGLPQGLSVYADGVRISESFGDTVNWDLLPLSAVHSVQLLAGTSPMFGLNSLGGVISLQMKNGFNYQGTAAEGWGGSFGRRGGALQAGDNNGTWGWYGNLDYFAEDGWRDHSRSEALRTSGTASYRSGEDRIDVSITHADSKLRGNGTSPVELLQFDRRAVFTYPDITDNSLTQLNATGTRALSERLKFSANAFFRSLDTSTFNGDGSIFTECQVGGEELLVEEDFEDLDDDGICTDVDTFTLVLDTNGSPIDAWLDGGELDAINNIGHRTQHNRGASMQLTHALPLAGKRRNDLLAGAAWIHGKTQFDSTLEVAQLEEDRSTTRTGIFASGFRTAVNSAVDSWSLYATDTLDLTEALSLTVSARFDTTHVTLLDRSGISPELDGSHDFSRVNPAVGVTWRGSDGLVIYGSLAQASRAPTAIELACADEDAPCNLPNAFLADPPLKEVVAGSAELGIRGNSGTGLVWQLGAFHTVNRHDILFQTTGGTQANVGYFANVGDTRRRGIELELEQQLGRLHWQLDYTLLDASFRDPFVVNSPHHPVLGEPGGSDRIVGEAKLQVLRGDHIPGLARHQANLGLDLVAGAGLRIGADLNWRSGVHLRGDEINLLGRTESFAVVNLRAEYRLSEKVRFFARIENLFNARYETFGLLGEPGEVFPDFSDPRFLGAGPPFGAWAGIRVQL